MKVYQELARAASARVNCEASGNTYWEGVWRDKVRWLVETYLPEGAGFDSGTSFDWEKFDLHPDRLEFRTAFHHMNKDGFYEGWTDHQVVVRADLQFGFQVLVKGKNTNDIKQYIHEVFESVLSDEVKDCPHDAAQVMGS